MIYDLIIVGAGPIGLACAIAAKKGGLKSLIIEKGMLVNSLFHFPTNMTFFSTSGLLEIGGVPFISHGDKPTRREALEYFRRVAESWHLDIRLYEKVEKIEPDNSNYLVRTSKYTYHCAKIILATGFYDTPNRLNIPGESLSKVRHYYGEPHPYVDQDIVVIGAGNSAADVALETNLKGARVTMVIREARLKSGIKYWIRPNIENRIKEGSIQAFFRSELTRIHQDRVDISTPAGPISLKNDFVLAMTGYRPNYPFLEKTGLRINSDSDKTPFHDEQTFETNLSGIYLAGVVCGGMNTGRWIIETARAHADAIINDICAKNN